LGAQYIFTVENKYKKQSSDVINTWSRIPLFHYKNFDELLNNIPYDCRLVGVEIDDNSEDLKNFEHPKRAIYLLGSEDCGLPPFVMQKCHFLVKIPGNLSLNVGIAGGIVLYDRFTKLPINLPTK
jgi:tRNA G18 (ribose-2'-O)-methylase SpoU